MNIKDFINEKYLNKKNILDILDNMSKQKPIKFICLDDFIKPDFYEKIKIEMRNIKEVKIDTHLWENRKSHSVWLEWENLSRLHNFFESKEFSRYLSIFFWWKLKREIYFDQNEINKYFPNLSNKWLLWQYYEKWDKFWWHIDWPINAWSLWTFTYYLYNSLEDNYDISDWWYFEFGKMDNLWNLIWYLKKEPLCNRILFLPVSDISWHQVSEIYNKNFKRFSIQSTLFKI